jgi:hypothetical protein
MHLPSRVFKWPFIALALLVFIVIYYALDPVDYSFFPKCPFYWITGYKCPGCGSQQVIHHLLHMDFRGAFKANPLLVISIPYILGGFIFDYTNLRSRFPRVRNVLYGKNAIIIVFIIVVSFWIIRNIY